MIALVSPQQKHRKIPVSKIPSILIYEIIDGNPLYYKGFEEVISNKKKLEDIMGCSSLQAYIINYLLRLIYQNTGENITVYTNESGLHLDKYNNLSGDILVYDSERLTNENVNDKYINIPPKIAIEIDVKADIQDLGEDGYFYKKTKKFLDFGVEKVIWIMSKSQRILIATPENDWIVKDWNNSVEIMNEITFNVGEYLRKNNIEVL
jgi:Uma2 family endonuclease